MKPRIASTGLAACDRRFEATFAGADLERLFPGGAHTNLLRRGVLVAAGTSLTIPHCICPLRLPDCVVRVETTDGKTWGYCNEYGSPLAVDPEQLTRYAFSWEAWARELRRVNRLDGVAPARGTGSLLVGDGTIAGRRFRLVVVAAGCGVPDDVVLPAVPPDPERATVALFLGAPVEGFNVDATLAGDALAADRVTLDAAALERALAPVPITVPPDQATYMRYADDAPGGVPIDDVEYARLHRRDVLGAIDILVDVPGCGIWRKGRACGVVLDANGRSTGKRILDRGVRLLAAYVRRPNVPTPAHKTSAYRGVPVSPRSAAVLFATVRRSIHGTEFLRSGARSSQPGETEYVFVPGDRRWCVIERLPPK